VLDGGLAAEICSRLMVSIQVAYRKHIWLAETLAYHFIANDDFVRD
jgi:hypothetical protein